MPNWPIGGNEFVNCSMSFCDGKPKEGGSEGTGSRAKLRITKEKQRTHSSYTITKNILLNKKQPRYQTPQNNRRIIRLCGPSNDHAVHTTEHCSVHNIPQNTTIRPVCTPTIERWHYPGVYEKRMVCPLFIRSFEFHLIRRDQRITVWSRPPCSRPPWLRPLTE